MIEQKFFSVAIAILLFFPPRVQSVDSTRTALEMTDENSIAHGGDLELIRNRVISDLLEPGIDEAQIKSILQPMSPDGSWPDIDYKDVSRTGFEHARHLENMFSLSRAYKKPGSSLYQNIAVKKAAFAALDFWLKHDFICDNWWWNEMGTPHAMINTLLVLDTDLSEKQISKGLQIAGRANLEASGARPGGDLIQIAGMLGKQALFRRDKTVLEKVVNVMADEIKVTTERGLQPDMSFHHRVDNVICTLSYGLGYANTFSYWAARIAGTRYTLPKEATNLLIDYYLDGVCKSMVYGKFPDPGAKNRDLSRQGTLAAAGSVVPENLLTISDYRKDELKEIISIRKGESEPALTSNRFFWHSEYFTHQRPAWFASVRMHSSRNHTMEQPHNEEGLKMHHVGDGANFISRTGEEYFDIFPVWDWQKVPGTTVVQKPTHPHWKEIARKGLTDFVGGVSDGEYGAAAFDFKSAHDPLIARKAWFYFDEEYVCLGSGITAEAGLPVFTTLNQCLLMDSDVLVKTRKKTRTLEEGKHKLPHVSWVLHNGIGYFFPRDRTIEVSNMGATGSWRDINHQARSRSEIVQQKLFSIWIDHGVNPRQAQYEYIVVPSTQISTLENYVKNSPVEILANTQEIQAALHNELNIAQIVFYQPGKIKINENISLSAGDPCIVMLRTNGRRIEQIVVSDPSRKLNTLQLKTTAAVKGSGSHWRSSWNKKENASVIDIDLPKEGYAGQSVVLVMPPL